MINKNLLIRNLMVLRSNYINYIILILVVPMLMYLFNIIPYLGETSKIWSSVGLWISSCSICSYIYMYQNMKSYTLGKKDFILNSPISFVSILLSNVIVCIFLLVVQFLFSYAFTLLINNAVLSILDCILLFINIIPIALLFMTMAMFFSLFDKLNLGLFICAILCLSIIQFFSSYTSFKDIYYEYIPLVGTLLNCASIFNNNTIHFSSLFLMYLIAISLLLIALVFISKIMESQNER